jgi:hypothetical protein
MSNGDHKYSIQWWRDRFHPLPPVVNFDRSKALMEEKDLVEAQRIIEAHTEFDPGDVRSVRVSTEAGYVIISMHVYIIDDGKRFTDMETGNVATTLEIITIPAPHFYEAMM